MPQNIQKWIVMMVQVTNTTLTIVCSIGVFTWLGQKMDEKVHLPVLGGSLFTIFGFIIGVLGAGAALRRFFVYLRERDQEEKNDKKRV